MLQQNMWGRGGVGRVRKGVGGGGRRSARN